MLFQGFSVEQKGTQGVDPAKGNAWEGHPFHRDNNVNGVDGDDDGDGEGRDVHTLVQPAVTRLQEAYVAKMIDTLGDLDHIVWEIGNECHPESVEWHGHMIGFIRQCERSRPKQHLIGMTSSPIPNPPLFASDADWISPMGRQYLEDPPRAEGRKLIVVDTDHILPWAYEPTWVWRNLCRGNHFILMDGYRDFRMGSPETPIAAAEPARRAMGQAVRLAERMDLGRMVPRPDLASSTYCLAAPGREYLVYLPDGGDVEIDLGGQEGIVFEGEWYEDTTETRRELATTGGVVRLATPFAGESLLWLRARA
jgi:hypothetical protein